LRVRSSKRLHVTRPTTSPFRTLYGGSHNGCPGPRDCS
jgi:hypothetical protein